MCFYWCWEYLNTRHQINIIMKFVFLFSHKIRSNNSDLCVPPVEINTGFFVLITLAIKKLLKKSSE